MNFRINYKKEKTEKKDVSLKDLSVRGKRVVITGTIPGMTRIDATSRLMRNFGATVSPNVTKRTQVLIVASTRGSTTKITRAKEYGVPILKIKSFSDLK